jgi:hypothetical protein
MPKRPKLPNGYWNNIQHCKAEAVKFVSRIQWQKESGSSYKWATKNKWVDECAAHMISIKKPDGYWTLERCKEEARKYKTKAEWRLTHRGSFSKANKEKWLGQCCEHMESKGLWFGPATILEFLIAHDIDHKVEYRFNGSPEIERRPFDFYLPFYNLIIEFHGEQHLTGWSRRDEDARSIQVRDLFKKNWALEQGIEFLEIKQWEINSKEDIFSTIREKIQQIAKIKNCEPPKARRELTKPELLRIKNRLKWTLEACVAEAQKYTTIKQWRTKSESSYQAAFKKNWIDDCSSHMSRALHKKDHWTLKRCIEDAKLYKTKSEWQQGRRSGYSFAIKNKWLEQCTSHMVPDGRKTVGQRIWTYEKCIELALSCKSRAEFKKASGSAYARARIRGWLDDCCSHMVPNKREAS